MHKVVGKMKQMLSFLFAKNSVGSPFSLESNKTYKGKFSKTIERVKEQNLSLPLEFHYEEPTRIGERFTFVYGTSDHLYYTTKNSFLKQ